MCEPSAPTSGRAAAPAAGTTFTFAVSAHVTDTCPVPLHDARSSPGASHARRTNGWSDEARVVCHPGGIKEVCLPNEIDTERGGLLLWLTSPYAGLCLMEVGLAPELSPFAVEGGYSPSRPLPTVHPFAAL